MATKNVNVVLAHGAWADGSSWARVITALKAEGVNASAAPLPLTSLADDVAALDRSLERTEGPVVLAGHAYAGAVIALETQTGQGAGLCDGARARRGREGRRRVRSPQAHPQAPKLAPDNNGLVWLPEEAFGGVRPERSCRRSRGALCRSAADIAGLHYRPSRAPALEGRAELVPRRGGRPNDRAEDAALHGGTDEGEDKGPCGRSRPDRDRSPRCRGNHSRCNQRRNWQLN